MLIHSYINEKAFAKSLNLKERYKTLKSRRDLLLSEDLNLAQLNKWIDKMFRSNKADFDFKLKMNEMTKEDFASLIEKIPESKEHLYIDELNEHVNLRVLEIGIELCESKPLSSEEDLGFIEFVRPFALYAAEMIDSSLKYRLNKIRYEHEEIKEMLVRSLVEELLNNAVRSLVLEFNIAKLREELVGETPEERFLSFVREEARNKENLIAFYEEYATLTRRLILRTEYFIQNVQMLLFRLNENWLQLQKEFQLQDVSLSEIKVGLGDTHQEGKTVVQLVFSSGKEILYKPKSMEITKSYHAFLEWMNEVSGSIQLPSYKVLDFGEYGWEEKILYKPCSSKEEVERYYLRFGKLIGLMHMLKGADLHFENIIAHGEYPYIIDSETIFHQYPKLNFPDSAEVKLKYEQSDSVIGSGLLPQAMFQNIDGKGIDLSALNGKEQDLPFKVLALNQNSKDEMEFTMKEAKSQSAKNLPKLGVEEIYVEDYLTFIIDGFQEMCKFFIEYKEEILSERGPLIIFKENKIRIVARATQQYCNFLQESTHPDYMRDSILLEQLFERVWYYPYENKELVIHEIQDLLRADVPIFTTFTDSRDLYSSTGERMEDFFKESGYEQVYNRIYHFDDKELEKQRGWLKLAIQGNRDVDIKVGRKGEYRSELLENHQETILQEAINIGEALVENVVLSDDKTTASWLQANVIHDKWYVAPMKQNLYDGLGGVALFLLYLNKVTGNEKYLEVAHKALKSAMNPLSKAKGLLSTFLGKYSLLYPLAHFQSISPRKEYQDFLEEIKVELKERLKEEEEFDLLSGSAGVIQVALNLFEMTKDQDYLDLADMYSKHLVENVSILESGVAWKNKHTNSYLGGFSHGTSGIAWSLWRSGIMNRNQEYIDLAKKAFAYDRSLFEKEESAWKDTRESEKKCLHQWCHGSTGIGLSRVLVRSYEEDVEMDEEIRVAVDNVRKYGFKNNDTLCHGNMGDTELLLAVSQLYGNKELYEQALQIGIQVINNYRETGSYQCDAPDDIQSFGMFVGIAGVGMQLLRLLQPNEIPSVMTLENVKG